MLYIAIGIILFILLKGLLALTAFVFLLPIILGVLIIVIVNAGCKSTGGKFAPVWWNVLTGVVILVSSVVFWNDVTSTTTDVGALPFTILLVYGLISLYALILPGAIKQHKAKKALKKQKEAEKTGTVVTSQVDSKSVSAEKDTPAHVVRAETRVATPQQLADTPSRVQQQQEQAAIQSYPAEDEYEYTSNRLARVRKNLTVDQEVFRQYGMTFKCNLIEECDTLQLNFELMNTKQLAAAIEKDTDLFIKANVYDSRGNLLCIEEVWVEYRQLRRGYASDFFYFSSESMTRAYSVKVYAIDPTDDFDEYDKEEFEVNFENERLEEPMADEDGSLDVPPEFTQIASSEYRKYLGAEPPQEFVQSAYRDYQGWDEDLRRGMRKSSSDPSKKVYDWKAMETWEDYPAPDYDAVHTYCQVALTENGRTYYYRTRNPELKVGDKVYVPFGYNAPKKIGMIVSMEEYVGHDAPFPLEKTKYIIGKVK